MINQAKFVAADLGASTGRVMVGKWDGSRFALEELHRFPNGGVRTEAGLHWDVPGIWAHMQSALIRYSASFGDPPEGIGVDAWGVDFGLLDARGRLLANPFHYRDSRTVGMPRRLFGVVPENVVFAATGTQTMEINTLFQLYSMVQRQDRQLESAHTLLMIPDLFLYFLGGEKSVEYTEATTTQMYSFYEQNWAEEMLGKVGISSSILPKVISPGTIVSNLQPTVLGKDNFYKPVPIVAVASHDTASAVAAIPDMDEKSAFISSGTWSLMGVETLKLNSSKEVFESHFTNEGSANGSVLLLKNITGLWILQECLEQWKSHGSNYAWEEIVQAALTAIPFQSLFDPNDSRLQVSKDMPGAIQTYCHQTAQLIPQTSGEIARAAFESLSLKYRSTLESLERLTQRNLQTIRVVGGGVLNTFLMQMTADACNRIVVAGPVEASALGNVMLQAIATNHLQNIEEGRAAMARSVKCVTYKPHSSTAWDEAYARFKNLEVD